jgi:peptidoglycan/LPS O-acetylase OafA/YrhL
MSRSLAEASEGRANHTAFVRFVLTSVVIYSHSFMFLWGTNEREPVSILTQRQASAGGLAVEGFLVLSGFLVTRSWFYSRGLKDFVIRRIVRVYPGFLAAVAFSGLIAVPFLAPQFEPTTGPVSFWRDLLPPALVLKYPLLWSNGSLWILPYELACYVMIVVLGLLGGLSRRRMILLLWLLNCSVFAGQIHGQMFQHHDMAISRIVNNYLAGVVFFLYRDSIRLSWAGFATSVLGLTLFGVVWATSCYLPFVSPLLWGYVLLFVCYYRVGPLQHFARYGDFSYGTFLYAFPIQLTLVMYLRESLHPITLFLAAWPIAAVFGVLSWFLVEQPFLRLKRLGASSSSSAVRTTPVLAADGASLGEPSERRRTRVFRAGAAGAKRFFKGPTPRRSLERSRSD